MDQRGISNRFRELLQRRDDDLPLDEMCLLISAMAGADIDVADELRALDAVATTVPASFQGLMTHLFQGPNAVRGNAEDYYDVHNSLLSEVRRRGLGIPISLSVLAIEIGRRAGVAVVGIGMPGHFLVRRRDDDTCFADPFGGGRLLDRDGARDLFTRITSGRAPWSDSYLRPVSAREILMRVLNNINVACNKDASAAPHRTWVAEFLSWFPSGAPVDARAAARAAAPFN